MSDEVETIVTEALEVAREDLKVAKLKVDKIVWGKAISGNAEDEYKTVIKKIQKKADEVAKDEEALVKKEQKAKAEVVDTKDKATGADTPKEKEKAKWRSPSRRLK